MSIPKKLDLIIEGLYISDWQSAIDRDLLEKHDINYVLCINNMSKRLSDFKVYEDLHITSYKIPLDDCEDANIKKWFKLTNNFIESCLRNKKRVLVHCSAGVSRSVSIVMAYLLFLIHCEGKRKPNCQIIHNLYKWIRERRPPALPNPGFYRQLIEFENECLKSQ